jgi:hypothetical protein
MTAPGNYHGNLFYTLLLTLLLLPAGCSDSSDNSSDSASKPRAANPVVEGPATAGGGPDCCRIVSGDFEIYIPDIIAYVPGTPFYPPSIDFDQAELGYEETEYYISGTAISYVSTEELSADGRWSVQPADSAPYKTRIVVVRPIDPADFSGTVMVEWFNVSGGTDAAPDFMQMHTELMRRGHAFVGVTAQAAGIEGGIFPAGLKIIDPERYGSLFHPGDSFSYDIYSQAAQAVRHPVGLDPLDGLKARYLIGVGESQSAGRMATYVNAIHPTIDLFDGFLIHSRIGGAAALSQAPQPEIAPPNPSSIRDDLPEPVIDFETEGDIMGLSRGFLVSPVADSNNFRLWEVPGNAHFDVYGVVKGPDDKGGDPGVAEVIQSTASFAPGLIDCALPINDGPGHWVAKAAIHALDRWIRTGEPAPTADRVSRSADGTDVARDGFGNALGGIRTPYVDAPVATFNGGGQSGDFFCGAFGTTALFDAHTLSMLYPTRDDYVDAIDTATDSAVDKGFILPEDGDLIKAQARVSPKFAQ